MIVDPLDLGELTGSQLLATGKKGKWESILIFGENNQMASGPSLALPLGLSLSQDPHKED